jgi:hypothetical protein
MNREFWAEMASLYANTAEVASAVGDHESAVWIWKRAAFAVRRLEKYSPREWR